MAEVAEKGKGKYQAYPEYKDSGVEWLGEIPSHWDAWKWKHTLSEGMLYGANEAALDDNRDNPRYIRITDMNSDGSLRGDSFKSLPGHIAESYLLNDGDVLVARTGATVGKSFLYKDEFGPCCFAGYLIRARVNDQTVEPQFVYWYLQSDQYWKYISGSQIQATIQNVSAEKYGEMYLSIPSLVNERLSIIHFLNHETAKIDTLIEKQQQLIKLLKEKRQAVISHAVTKGLNPDVPMRDSGVEWLEEVPGHWSVTRFKHLVVDSAAGPYGASLTKSMYTTSGIRVYGQQQVIPDDFSIGDYYISEDKFSEMKRYEVFPNDVLISVMGTVGKVAIVPEDIEQGIINPRLVKYKVKEDKILPHFVKASILSDVSQSQLLFAAQGSTMDGLNMQILGALPIPHPSSLDEQAEILNEVKRQNLKFDNLLNKAQITVQLLTERRTALISAAVTGKIDVRNWVAPVSSTSVSEGNKDVA